MVCFWTTLKPSVIPIQLIIQYLLKQGERLLMFNHDFERWQIAAFYYIAIGLI